MSKYTRIFTLVLLVLVFSNLGPTAVKAQNSFIPAIEREALVALYNSTDGDNWDRNDGWLTDPDPCNWDGVVCIVGHVDNLNLGRNNLSGSIPPEIGNLSNLKYLWLWFNQLTNLPSEIGNLMNLHWLHLESNQLSSIPPEIGNLMNLEGLDLRLNQLTSLPPEIGNLTNLDYLELGFNQLTSLPPEIGNLTNLYFLDLSNNQLTSLPSELGNLSELVYLYLPNNEISTLPSEIGNLTNLDKLFLQNNKLSTLPPGIGNLVNLDDLLVTGNQLTSIPPEIGNLTLLELDLSNQQLKNIPPELGNMSDLERLYLDNNELISLPSEIGNLAKLDTFTLNNNQLNSIPPELSNLNNLPELDLSYNRITLLPTELGYETNIPNLDLSYNQISSIPPLLGNLTNFQVIDLRHNLVISISPGLGNETNLPQIDLSHNQITSIPPEICNDTTFPNLDLTYNQITSIPTELTNLTNLKSLDLSNNHISNLPPEIGNLINLGNLNLSQNKLSGSIPPEIGNLINLGNLYLSGNALSGEIPSTITNLTNISCHGSHCFWIHFGIHYNMLTASNIEVINFLDSQSSCMQPNWAETQTIAPSAITETDATPTSVELSWTPIPYTGNGGYYQISYAQQAGGPYTVHGMTSDKTASSYTIDNLTKHNSYYFVIQTYTPTHNEQKNELLTGYSMEVEGVPRVFWDVLPTNWSLPFVETIFDAGITTGCSADPLMYCLEKTTTRAETAVFLEKGMHGAGFFPPDVTPTFGDTAGHWAEDWIEALYSDGMTSGCSQDPLLYCPDSSTTRAEMAVFLLKAKHGNTYTPPPASGGAFSDVAGHWAEAWIEELYDQGITGGYPDGTYRPGNQVTRAEMAVFLVNAFNIP